MIAQLKNIVSSTLHLFYPHVCTGCGSDLLQEDNLLCLKCIHNLPHTNFAALANNQIEKDFWGRIQLTAAYSQFYFSKEFLIQHLIHQLKYRGDTKNWFLPGRDHGKNFAKQQPVLFH